MLHWLNTYLQFPYNVSGRQKAQKLIKATKHTSQNIGPLYTQFEQTTLINFIQL